MYTYLSDLFIIQPEIRALFSSRDGQSCFFFFISSRIDEKVIKPFNLVVSDLEDQV